MIEEMKEKFKKGKEAIWIEVAVKGVECPICNKIMVVYNLGSSILAHCTKCDKTFEQKFELM